MNGDEHGVDCGGSCALLCPNESRAPVISWSRAFNTSPQTYTAAAYIQNGNVGAGARQVGYSFQLFDADNILVVERDGVVDLPPVQIVPIIETGINVGNRSVARTLFAFSTVPMWQRAGALPALHMTGQTLAPDGSRLSATLANDSLVAARATVAAVLFDQDGVARAASKSTLSVGPRSSVPLTFTWVGGVPNVVRAELTILPLP